MKTTSRKMAGNRGFAGKEISLIPAISWVRKWE